MNAEIYAYLETRLDDFLSDLALLVSMDSYSFDKEDVNHVNDWLEKRLNKMGFTVVRHPNEKFGDDLAATRNGKGAGRLMLLGHTDTVYPHGIAAQRPLSFQGDKILGPGVGDMKGGLLTAIYAIEALDAVGFDNYGEIIYFTVSDEEIDERHAVPLIREISRRSDVALTLEGARANGDIVVARKGVRSFVAEAFGHPAHSGVEPEKGHHAILALAHQIIALQALNDPVDQISLNVGVIEGGQLRNIVPAYARIHFEARAFTPELLERITKQVYEVFERETVPGVTFKVSYSEAMPPMPRTEAVAALEAMAGRIADELGFNAKGARTGGAGDASFVADEGVPVLDGLGPQGGLDHGPDEYILKSSIVPRATLLARMLKEFAEQKSAETA
ncbi:MAG: M20 family metallopeptidase [Burkholderiales bacterium]|nr:M20 family metallopeptidase [Anaerolineae bacterium]